MWCCYCQPIDDATDAVASAAFAAAGSSAASLYIDFFRLFYVVELIIVNMEAIVNICIDNLKPKFYELTSKY